MRIARWFVVGVLALLFAGCASTRTSTPEAQQALAPTGKLRVAFLSAPLYVVKDPATGELKGQAVDLGKELARRVGVPFEPVPYANAAAILSGAKSGEWDVVLMGINAERAAAIDFSAPYLDVEQGYLVRAGVPISTMADVDRPGIRIAVIEKAGADLYHSNNLKNATLVRAKSVDELFDTVFVSKQADVIAATRSTLFERSGSQPGSRVLDGRFLVEPVGMGVPKGRKPIAASYVGNFAEEAKAANLVKTAIDRAGLRGVAVAPLK